MRDIAAAKLEELRSDFSSAHGAPFRFFYCPILFNDEDVELCEAHVINESFPSSSRKWTIQRKDVDNFFGAHFEADFVGIQHIGRFSPEECFVSKDLVSTFKPKLLLHGEVVPHYHAAKGQVPAHHATVLMDSNAGQVLLGLKTNVDRIETAAPDAWQVQIEKDFRLSALVSLIKSAYLTLFERFGYRYVLGPSGRFVGDDVLGKFHKHNRNQRRSDVIVNAMEHFAQFKNMVRPAISRDEWFDSTVDTGRLLICETLSGEFWGLIVFVRAAETRHAVLLPILDRPDAINRFMSFLNADASRIHVRMAVHKDLQFELQPSTVCIEWPAVELT